MNIGINIFIFFVAVFLDGIAFGLIFFYDTILMVFIFLLMHIVASIIITLFVYKGLPKRYKYPKKLAYFFVFSFVFFIPFISHIGFFIFNIVFSKHKIKEEFIFNQLEIEKILIMDEIQYVKRFFGEEGVAAYIKNKKLNPDLRLKAFLIISEIINPLNMEFLKLGLSDNVDEIRMLSFAIISRVEKQLNDEIYELSKNENEENRLKMAKLYWEFIYLNLADEIFQKIIINKILDLLKENSSKEAKMLYLKIYLLEQDFLKIKSLLSEMEENKETAPYFMELAYYEKDFKRLKELIKKYPEIKYIPKFYPLYRLWNEDN
jgi:hypothetical protein